MKKILFNGLAVAAAILGSLSFAPQVEAATAANWVECANEGNDCYFHNASNQITAMRYGNPGSYRYMWVRNRYNGNLDCDNHAGDPDRGHNKKCQFSKYNFYDIPNNETDWNYLCNEGNWCVAPGGTEVRWMRYGLDGKYFYQPISPNQLFKCDHNHMFGDKDPYKGKTKKCWIMKTYLDSTKGLGKESGFVHCANEGSTCHLPSLRPTIVRYGAWDSSNNRYRYITAIVSNDQLSCNNDMFREDPVKVNKYCEYMPLEYKTDGSHSAWGQWKPVVDNEGSGSQSLDFQIWTGVSTTDTDSTSQEWSRSITVGIEAEGLSIGPAKVKTSLSVSESYGESSTFSSALNKTQQERVGVNCSSTTGGFLKMWRFETDISFTNCLSEGICDFKVQPLSTVCTTADVVPQCVPGQCVPGTNCQQCYQN